MTQKMQNADASSRPRNQGDVTVGTTILNRNTKKATASPIPSPETLRALIITDLQTKLTRLQTIDSPTAAIIAVYDVLDCGWHSVDPRDLIRAIEARLPKPTASQIDAASLRRSRSTGKVFATRPIAAFGDIVIVLTNDNPDGRPYHLRATPIISKPEPAAWDITRPKARRTTARIIDADEVQQPSQQKPTGGMIVC